MVQVRRNYCRVRGQGLGPSHRAVSELSNSSEKEPADCGVSLTEGRQIDWLFHSSNRVDSFSILTTCLIYMETYCLGFVEVAFVKLFEKSHASKTQIRTQSFVSGLKSSPDFASVRPPFLPPSGALPTPAAEAGSQELLCRTLNSGPLPPPPPQTQHIS